MIYAAIILGFAGSLHCLGMCGPLALALPGGNKRWGPLLFSRLLYNVGRIVTYTLIGCAMGLLGTFVSFAGYQQILSLVIGATLLLGLVFYRHAAFAQRWVGVLQKNVASLLRVEHPGVLFPIGILNGLLPCGSGVCGGRCVGVAGWGGGRWNVYVCFRIGHFAHDAGGIHGSTNFWHAPHAMGAKSVTGRLGGYG